MIKLDVKGNVNFDGFDKFTQDVSKSIGKLEELQNILKALQNIEITLAKASGIASITELENQWANVEKRIINATKLDGSFRKNASISKIASEYQKYIDMGGTNSIADIDKIKGSKDTIDTIISKTKEFAKQDLTNDSVNELSIELDGIIGKFDELIATVKTATNALYKIIKQTGVSELDKQWSSITNKFKSFADESGKINLSKQSKVVQQLLVMYQRYVNIGGSHTPFDLTDNIETVNKLDKAYKKLNEVKPINNSSNIESESESFKKVEQSVDSLAKAIGDTKVQAINIEATAMEDAAEREILAINAIVDNLNMVVSKLKEIKGIKIPKIKVEDVTSTAPVETNILSENNLKEQIKNVELLTDRTGKLVTVYRGLSDSFSGLYSSRYGGKTFFTDSYNLAKSYASEQFGHANAFTGKVYESNLSFENPLEFDAFGSEWNKISLPKALEDYLQKTRIQLSNRIKKFYEDISNETDNDVKSVLNHILNNFIIETSNHFNDENFVLKDLNGLYLGDATYFEQYINSVFNNLNDVNLEEIDLSNLKSKIINKLSELFYIQKDIANNMLDSEGIYNGDIELPIIFQKIGDYYTDEIIHLAENAGYDSVIFKNLIDGSSKPENIFVSFNKEQIKNAKLIDQSTQLVKEKYSKLFDLLKLYKNLSDGTIEDAIKTYVDEYLDPDTFETKYFDDSLIENALKDGVKYIDHNKIFFDKETGQFDSKEGEIERFISDLTQYAKDVEVQYQKITNPEISTSSTSIKDTFKGDTSEIDKAVESTENLAQAQKELNIIFDEKGSKDYWEGRFKEGLSDMTKTNEELVKMKSYYKTLEKESAKLNTSISLLNTLNKYTDESKYKNDFISRVKSLQEKLVDIDITNPKDIDNLRIIQNEVDKIVEDSKLLENKLVKQDSKLGDIISKMKIYRNDNSNMSKTQKTDLENLINFATELEKAGKVTASDLEEIKKSFSKIKSDVSDTGREGLNFVDRVVQRTKDINSKFFAQYFSWQDWIRYARKLVDNVREIDTALTELRKVSDATETRLTQNFKNSAETAKYLGATVSDVISATADWSRMGYSVDESEELARVSILYKNVGDGIEIEDANNSLISTLQGYQLVASEAESVVDKFNEVSNNFAITSGGIGEALQRSAASFNAANTDLSKSIALVTATNEVVQNPESVGTLWKTLSARIRGASTELSELGEETDEYTESTSKLRDLVNSLTGFDIMQDEDTFKDIYEIIMGIGKEWNNLTDIEQASLGEALAGKRNSNALYAVLGNLDTLQEAYETAENSAGSAMKEQEDLEKSIQYSLDRLTASTQEWSATLVDSDVIKFFVDLANAVVELSTAITPLGTIGLGAGLFAVIKNFGRPKMFGLCFEIAEYHKCSLGY